MPTGGCENTAAGTGTPIAVTDGDGRFTLRGTRATGLVEVASESHATVLLGTPRADAGQMVTLVASAQEVAYRALWSLTGKLPKWGKSKKLRYEEFDAMSNKGFLVWTKEAGPGKFRTYFRKPIH